MPDPVAVQDITIVQGEDTPISFALQNGDESAFDLTGWACTCEVRRSYDSALLFRPALTMPLPVTGGIVTITPTVAQSFSLRTAQHPRFDILGVHATSGTRRLLKGKVIVDEAITHGS